MTTWGVGATGADGRDTLAATVGVTRSGHVQALYDWRCISVVTVTPRITCPSCVRRCRHRSLKSPNDSIFVRQAAAYTRRAKNTVRYVPSCVRREQRPAWSRTQHRQLRSPIENAFVSAVFGTACVYINTRMTANFTFMWQSATLQWQCSVSPRASVMLITGCVPADWDSIQPRRK